MPPTEAEIRALGRRLAAARSRLLSDHGFYGLLLMHMRFALGDEYETAWVSLDTIAFNPDFVARLDADELCFVLQHEVLHAALGHLARQEGRDRDLWNLACDIVVNSNIMHGCGDDAASITLRCQGGASWHVAPDGREGWHYAAEEVYEQLVAAGATGVSGDSGLAGADEAEDVCVTGHWDVHVFGGHEGEDATGAVTVGIAGGAGDASADEAAEAWVRRLGEAVATMRARDPDNVRGLVPVCAERRLGELRGARADWRQLLGEFVQDGFVDYTLARPDRRLAWSDVVLPSFAAAEACVRDVLFAVDASGSVGDRELTCAFSEIVGAIEQFGGRLSGWVTFFDAQPCAPERFEDVRDVLAMRPKGGGGTRFEAVFECVERWLDFDGISSIVILTDGYAPYPERSMARGVSVLWLIAGTGPEPAWGRVARLRDRPW